MQIPTETIEDSRDVRPHILAILPYIVFLFLCGLLFRLTTDDPFITFRYARNILNGYGPVFNPGERVEGYSSPLHLILSVLLEVVAPSVGIVIKAKVVSIVFGLLTIWRTGALATSLKLSPWERLLAQALMATNASFAASATNGLETTLYGFILLLATLQFLQEQQTGRGIASALLLFLAVLARPEAMIVAGTFAVIRIYTNRKNRQGHMHSLGWTSTLLISVVFLFIARHAYYGQLFPNTYYAKSIPMLNALKDGIAYLLSPIKTDEVLFYKSSSGGPWYDISRSLLIKLLYGVWFWTLAIRGALRLKNDSYLPVLLAPIAATILFILRSGGDWMYGWRFGMAIIPFLSILQVVGLRSVSSEHTGLPGMTRLQMAGLTVSILASIVIPLHVYAFTLEERCDWSDLPYVNAAHPRYAITAKLVQQEVPAGATIAYSEMGYVAFQNQDKRFIDLRGLTNREIASLPSRYKSRTGLTWLNWLTQDCALRRLVFARRPDYIITFDFIGFPDCDVPSEVGPYRRCWQDQPILGYAYKRMSDTSSEETNDRDKGPSGVAVPVANALPKP